MSSSSSNGLASLQFECLFLQIGTKHPNLLIKSDTHAFLQYVVEVNNKITIFNNMYGKISRLPAH